MEQPCFERFLAAKSGRSALREFAQGNTEIVTRVGQLDDIIRSAAHEPDAFAVRARTKALRPDSVRPGVALARRRNDGQDRWFTHYLRVHLDRDFEQVLGSFVH